MTNMMIGPQTAQLLSEWIIDERIDITHLLLSKNNLGDEGISKLAEAIALSKSIVCVDFAQNGLTPKCAKSIQMIICNNESLVDLNIGSIKGANRNRLGHEGGLAVAKGFYQNKTLIQTLSLRSTTLSNEEVELIAESLDSNMFIRQLDLAENRLEGTRAGNAIARILKRKNEKRGGDDLQILILAHNKLGPSGFLAITYALALPSVGVQKLDISYNDIRTLKQMRGVNENSPDFNFGVVSFIFDGNQLQHRTAKERLVSTVRGARRI